MDLCRHRLRLDGAGTVRLAAAVLDEAFVRGFVAGWVGAWNAHDADALLALCAEDIVWDDPAAQGTLRGHAGARGFLDETWTTFPDLAFESLGAPLVALAEERAAQVWRMRGTMLGPSSPGFAPTGRAVDLVGVDLYAFRDGVLVRYEALYDLLETGRQMGLVPPEDSRAAKVGAFLQRTSMRLRRRPQTSAPTVKQTKPRA